MKKLIIFGFLIVFLAFSIAPVTAEAAISFVSSTCESSDDGVGSYTLTLPTTQQDDLVIIAVGIGDNDNVDEDVGPNLVGIDGYTEVADLFSNDTQDTNLGVFWKFMGATPDTSYTLDSIGGNDASNAAVCIVFRGVDTTTPMDVTPTTATGIDVFSPNPPSINHNNPSGVWTVIAGASGHTLGGTGTYTFPTGYTTNVIDRGHNDTSDATVGLGYRSSGVSDPEDPGVMTHSGSNNTAFSWTAATLALRPAVAAAPTVTTQAETNVTQTSATVNGNITATGGDNATVRGFAWGTNSLLSGGDTATTTENGSFGTGAFTGSLSSLTCNTTYYSRPYATNPTGTGYGTIDSFTTSACAPTVTTQSESGVTQTSATLNGNISSTGGSNATDRGFAWSTDANLITGVSTTTESGSFGTGAFSTGISSLTCNTTYFARAYATNSGGTGYGEINALTTEACAPTVTTSAASSITASAATLNGDITATGGEDATVRGFAWGTNSTLSGGDTATTTNNGSFGTGAFTESLSSLTCVTTYYARAYATNSGGTSHGSIESFQTSACAAPPELEQLHFRWRHDDAIGTLNYAADEDIALESDIYPGDRKRIRFTITNNGGGSADNAQYELYHASSTDSCTAYVLTPSNSQLTNEHWVMDATTYVYDNDPTIDSPALTNPAGKSFKAGYFKTFTPQTPPHSLTNSEFTELSYTIRSTANVLTNPTYYCFKLLADGFTITYTQIPTVRLTPASARPVGGGGGGNSAAGGESGSGGGSPQGGGGQGGGQGGGGEGQGGGGGGQGGGGAGGGGGDTGFLWGPNYASVINALSERIAITTRLLNKAFLRD